MWLSRDVVQVEERAAWSLATASSASSAGGGGAFFLELREGFGPGGVGGGVAGSECSLCAREEGVGVVRVGHQARCSIVREIRVRLTGMSEMDGKWKVLHFWGMMVSMGIKDGFIGISEVDGSGSRRESCWGRRGSRSC